MSRRIPSLLLCLFALALFSIVLPIQLHAQQINPCDPPPPPPPPFDGPVLSGGGPIPADTPTTASVVTVANGRFWVDGQPYRHVGVNGGFYQGSDIWNDTFFMRQGGIKQLRIILPNTSYPNPQDVISKLEGALAAAWSRGIRITVVLTDYYYSNQWGSEGLEGHDVVPGDEGFYNHVDPKHPGICMLDYNWISGGFRANYKPFVQAIVGHFAGDGRIFAWEIGNEIGSPPKPNGSPAVAETVAFYREMAQFIRGIDPAHLVAPGIICTEALSLTSKQKVQLYEFMSYVTEHHYEPEHNSGSLADDGLAWALNKPLVIEEFGVRQTLPPYSGDHDLIMPTVSDFFDWAYADEPAKTADSVMVWGVDFGSDLGANDEWYGPTAQGLASQYLQLWRESADWLRPSPRYSDVQVGSTFYDHIECLSNRRAVSGRFEWVDDTHNDEFRPGEPITRADAIKAIVRAMGYPLSFPPTPHFTDVPRSNPYYRYIETARERGIIEGYPDATFRPDAHLTRGQMTKVIVLGRGWQTDYPHSDQHFVDVPQGHTFFDYVDKAFDKGLIHGYPGGYFNPQNETTRGQFAQMLGVAVGCSPTTD